MAKGTNRNPNRSKKRKFYGNRYTNKQNSKESTSKTAEKLQNSDDSCFDVEVDPMSGHKDEGKVEIASPDRSTTPSDTESYSDAVSIDEKNQSDPGIDFGIQTDTGIDVGIQTDPGIYIGIQNNAGAQTVPDVNINIWVQAGPDCGEPGTGNGIPLNLRIHFNGQEKTAGCEIKVEKNEEIS